MPWNILKSLIAFLAMKSTVLILISPISHLLRILINVRMLPNERNKIRKDTNHSCQCERYAFLGMLDVFALIVLGGGGMRCESQACFVWDIRGSGRIRMNCHSSDTELIAKMEYFIQTFSQMFRKNKKQETNTHTHKINMNLTVVLRVSFSYSWPKTKSNTLFKCLNVNLHHVSHYSSPWWNPKPEVSFWKKTC